MSAIVNTKTSSDNTEMDTISTTAQPGSAVPAKETVTTVDVLTIKATSPPKKFRTTSSLSMDDNTGKPQDTTKQNDALALSTQNGKKIKKRNRETSTEDENSHEYTR